MRAVAFSEVMTTRSSVCSLPAARQRYIPPRSKSTIQISYLRGTTTETDQRDPGISRRRLEYTCVAYELAEQESRIPPGERTSTAIASDSAVGLSTLDLCGPRHDCDGERSRAFRTFEETG